MLGQRVKNHGKHLKRTKLPTALKTKERIPRPRSDKWKKRHQSLALAIQSFSFELTHRFVQHTNPNSKWDCLHDKKKVNLKIKYKKHFNSLAEECLCEQWKRMKKSLTASTLELYLLHEAIAMMGPSCGYEVIIAHQDMEDH